MGPALCTTAFKAGNYTSVRFPFTETEGSRKQPQLSTQNKMATHFTFVISFLLF